MGGEVAILRLKVDANGAVTGFREYDGAAGRSVASSRRAEDSIRGVGNALKAIAAGAAVRELVQTSTAMDRINARMLQYAGNHKAAAVEMAFVRSEAHRLGLDLQKNAFAYTGWAVSADRAGISGQNIRKVYLGVAEASAAMNLSGEDSAGILRAFEQMASKGTVSAEELRGQVGERLPGAFSMAAKAMNMTEKELSDAMQTGDILARDLLPRLAEEMHNTFGPQADANADNLQANLNRISSAWFELAANAGKSGGLVNDASAGIAKGLQFLADNWNALQAGVYQSLANITKRVFLFADDMLSIAEEMSSIYGKFVPDFVSTAAEDTSKSIARIRTDLTLLGNTIESDYREKADAAVTAQVEMNRLAEKGATLFGGLADRIATTGDVSEKLAKHLAKVNFEMKFNDGGVAERAEARRARMVEITLGINAKVLANLERQDQVVKSAITDEQKRNAILGEALRLRALGVLTEEQLGEILRDNATEFEVHTKKLSEWAETLQQANENALRGMQSAFAGFFKTILTEGKFTWKELGKELLNLFASIAAELLAKWVVLELQKTIATAKAAAARAAIERNAQAAGGSRGGGGIGDWAGMATQAYGASGSGGGGAAGGAGALVAVVAVAAVLFIAYKWAVSKAQQKWAEISLRTGEITGTATSMAEGIKLRFHQIFEAIDKVSDAYDLGIKEIGDVRIQAHKGRFVVSVFGEWGGSVFKTIEEAQEAAAVLAIRFGELGDNVSTFMKAIVRGSDAMTLEALQADIAFGQMIENLGRSELNVRLGQMANELDAWRDRLVSLLSDKLDALMEGLNNINIEEARRWGSERDRITGRERTPAEEAAQREQDRVAFNARQTLRIAELRMDAAALAAKAAGFRRMLELVQAEGNLDQERLNMLARSLEVEGRLIGGFAGGMQELLGWSAEALQQQLALLDIQIQAINDLIAQIEAVGPINVGDLLPTGGRRGGGRGQRQSDREELAGMLRDSARQGLNPWAAAIQDLNDKVARGTELAHGDAAALAELAKMREREIELLRQQVRENYRAYLGPALGGTFGMTDMQAGIAGFLAELWAIPRELMPDWMKRLIETRFLAEQLGGAVDRLRAFGGDFFPTAAIDAVRAEAAGLREDFTALAEAGAITSEALQAFLDSIEGAEQFRLQQIGFGIIDRLFGYLEGSEQFEERRVEFTRMKVELEFAIMKAQLIALNMWTEWADVFDAALADALRAAGGIRENLQQGAHAIHEALEGWLDEDALRAKLRSFTDQAAGGFNAEWEELNTLFWDPMNGLAWQARFYGIELKEVAAAWEGALNALRERVLEPIRDLRRQLEGPQYSIASPESQIATTQQLMMEAFRRAMGGDLDAYQQFAEYAQQLLGLAQSGYGSGTGYGYYHEMISELARLLEGAGIRGSALHTVQSADAAWQSRVLDAMGDYSDEVRRASAQAHADARDQRLLLAQILAEQQTANANAAMAQVHP